MRVGHSDTKNIVVNPDARQHRIILPVYIPRHTGYFKDAAKILELCLGSLCLTTGDRVRVTIVANSCASDVLDVLHERFEQGSIDQLGINR